MGMRNQTAAYIAPRRNWIRRVGGLSKSLIRVTFLDLTIRGLE